MDQWAQAVPKNEKSGRFSAAGVYRMMLCYVASLGPIFSKITIQSSKKLLFPQIRPKKQAGI